MFLFIFKFMYIIYLYFYNCKALETLCIGAVKAFIISIIIIIIIVTWFQIMSTAIRGCLFRGGCEG